MGGRHVRLAAGRYTLAVSGGEGPAGVHRCDGTEVRLEVDGGRRDFRVNAEESVYYWWRGPEERPGVRLLGLTENDSTAPEVETWPTATTG